MSLRAHTQKYARADEISTQRKVFCILQGQLNHLGPKIIIDNYFLTLSLNTIAKPYLLSKQTKLQFHYFTSY